MSLVNNMLRDLDQRRKESSGPSGAVKLMPAREFVSDEENSFLPYVILGFILLAAVLAYYWYSTNQAGVERQLDIQFETQASNQIGDSERLIQELEESILQSEEAVQAEQVATAQAEVPSSRSLAELVESRPNPVASTAAEENFPEETASIPTRAAETSVQSPPVVEADPSLVRGGPIESVKEAPEFSNEQLDTIAVQEALRQISNGQTEDAYATLEQFILGNRYAHQSRETYAKLLMSRGNLEDANALIDAGLELAPNHAGFKKVKARLLMGVGNISDAVGVLISRAPDLEDDSEYHDLLASAQLSSRDFAGAVISYRGLVQYDQTQGKWWYGFAAAHDQLGNSGEARQAYSRAIQFSNLSASLRRRSQERLGALSLQ